MLKRFIYISFIIFAALSACTPTPEQPDELVVEGWITEGQHPIVLIHKTYSLTSSEHQGDIDANTPVDSVMLKQMLPLSRVAIHDGEKEIVLTGRIDERYMPPIVFTTTDIIGKAGQQYDLTVDYKDMHARASSLLREPLSFDSITTTCNADTKQTYVQMYLSQLPEDCYFMVQYRAVNATQFELAPFSVHSSGEAVDGKMVINIVRHQPGLVNSQAFATNKQQYIIRLARIGKAEYTFFSGLSSQLMTQGMFFVPIFGNIPSNVEGGVGYWAAMGVTDKQIAVNRDTTYLP